MGVPVMLLNLMNLMIRHCWFSMIICLSPWVFFLLPDGEEKLHMIQGYILYSRGIHGFSFLNKCDSLHSCLITFLWIVMVFLFLICSTVLISHKSCMLCMTLVLSVGLISVLLLFVQIIGQGYIHTAPIDSDMCVFQGRH